MSSHVGSIEMRMGCSDCDCVVEGGRRVETCEDPQACCCTDVPVA